MEKGGVGKKKNFFLGRGGGKMIRGELPEGKKKEVRERNKGRSTKEKKVQAATKKVLERGGGSSARREPIAVNVERVYLLRWGSRLGGSRITKRTGKLGKGGFWGGREGYYRTYLQRGGGSWPDA